MTNLVTTAIASSAQDQARLKVDLIEDGPVVLIRVLIDSLQNKIPPPLLDGIGLEFTAESVLRPSEIPNTYQGLVITREYLKLLGSRLDTTWGEEGGTLRFSFDLKLISTRSKTGEKGLDNQSNYGNFVRSPETVKVLLVEDNMVNMRIAKTMLKRLGFEAETAENGLEAVSKMHQTEFDIILMVCSSRFVCRASAAVDGE
jgi:hypothetical protein